MGKNTKEQAGIPIEHFLIEPNFKRDKASLAKEIFHLEQRYQEIAIAKGCEFQKQLQEAAENSIQNGIELTQEEIENIRRNAHKLSPEEQRTFHGLQQARSLLDAFEDTTLCAAKKGLKFKPQREKGAISKKTKYIHNLAKEYPELPAKALFKKADKEIIGNMAARTFANHVSDARST